MMYSLRCRLASALLAMGSAVLFPGSSTAAGTGTERQYLSGHGPTDAMPWEFTITGGRRAGEATTIPVPSNWEQHGFGNYNYGQELTPKSSEHGLYRLHFAVPEAWKGRRIRIVFDGAMTDATVKLNGRSAGPTHQGAFYRFHYDITSLVKYGSARENLLEVDVAKVSANADTETAERGGDYWVFGGIFRPVWLEAAPVESIENTAIDARADGTFAAVITIAGDREGGSVEAQIVGRTDSPQVQRLPSMCPRAVRVACGWKQKSLRRASGLRRRRICMRCTSRCEKARRFCTRRVRASDFAPSR